MRRFLLFSMLLVSAVYFILMYTHKEEFYRIVSFFNPDVEVAVNQDSELLNNKQQQRNNFALLYAYFFENHLVPASIQKKLDDYFISEWPEMMGTYLAYLSPDENNSEYIIPKAKLLSKTHPETNRILAYLNFEGKGMPVNLIKAHSYLQNCGVQQSLCDLNLAYVENYMIQKALIKLEDQSLSNDKYAIRDLEFLANQNSIEAFFVLGWAYDTSHGFEEDPEKAFHLYAKAALDDHPASQVNLAALYMKGRGVKKNTKKAIYWYSLAKKNGYPNLERVLYALRKQNDKSTYLDAATYHSLLKEAQTGNPAAQYRFYYEIVYGESIDHDYYTAGYWLNKAAKQNYKSAVNALRYTQRECDLFRKSPLNKENERFCTIISGASGS